MASSVLSPRYFHRSLNIPKLVDSKFTYVPRNSTLARLAARHKLPSATSLPGLREMVEEDVPAVKALYDRYMARFKMVPEFSEEEIKHTFVSGRGKGDPVEGRREGQVVWSFVVEVDFFHPSLSAAMKLTPFEFDAYDSLTES